MAFKASVEGMEGLWAVNLDLGQSMKRRTCLASSLPLPQVSTLGSASIRKCQPMASGFLTPDKGIVGA